MPLFLHLIPEWSGPTMLAVLIGAISVLRLTYWHYFKRSDALARERAKSGTPSAEDNGGIPQGPQGWPLVGSLSALGHEPHRALADLAHIYGDVVKVQLGAFPTLVVSTMELAKEVLVKQAAGFCVTGQPVRITEVALGWNRLAPASKEGEKRAQVMSAALDDALKKVRSSGAVSRAIRRACATLVAAIKEELADAAGEGTSRWSQVTALRSTLRRAALDVLVDVAFGVPLGQGSSIGQDSSDQESRRSSLAMLELVLPEMWQLVNTPVLADHVPLLRVATSELTNRCRFLSRERGRIVRETVEETKQAHAQKSLDSSASSGQVATLVDALRADKAVSGLADGEVVTVVGDFVQRGALPIAATLEWALAELTSHEEVQKQLYQEVEVGAFVKEGEEPRQALARMRLLPAVVLETLRLHPSKPLSAPCQALADLTLGGYTVDRGQNVVINSWALGQDARLFRSPSEFSPARFFPDPLPSLLEGKDLYWSSFSTERSDLTLDLVTHFLGALVSAFEWAPGLTSSASSIREGPGIEVSEPNFPLSLKAQTRR